jgi:hypothetical protein
MLLLPRPNPGAYDTLELGGQSLIVYGSGKQLYLLAASPLEWTMEGDVRQVAGISSLSLVIRRINCLDSRDG